MINPHYQRPIAIFVRLLIAAVLLSLMACRTAKQQETSIEHSAVSSYLNEVTVKSLPVYDHLLFEVGTVRTAKPDCDSVCQLAVEDFAARLQTIKQSGENRYSLLYDKYNKQLQLNITQGEIIDRFKDQGRDSTSVVIKEKVITKTVYKTSAFMRWSAYLGWFFVLYIIYRAQTWIRKKFFTPLV